MSERRQAELETINTQRASESTLHFETELERQTRRKKERETKDTVSVAFRLSSPQANYIYCGQIESLHQQTTQQFNHQRLHPLDHTHVRFQSPPASSRVVKPVFQTGLSRQRSHSLPDSIITSTHRHGYVRRAPPTLTSNGCVPVKC